MKRLSGLYLLAASLLVQFAPLPAWAGEGLDVPQALNRKVPLEGLGGLRLLLSKLYNDNLWLYAIACTVLMGLVGMGIATIASFILKSMGMEVQKIEHRE